MPKNCDQKRIIGDHIMREKTGKQGHQPDDNAGINREFPAWQQRQNCRGAFKIKLMPSGGGIPPNLTRKRERERSQARSKPRCCRRASARNKSALMFAMKTLHGPRDTAGKYVRPSGRKIRIAGTSGAFYSAKLSLDAVIVPNRSTVNGMELVGPGIFLG